MDKLVSYAQGNLTSRERDALNARGVTDAQIESFKVGYIHRRLPDLESAEEFLQWSHRGSKLDDMFVLPLTTALGAVQGFQFRHVERERRGYTDYFVTQDEPVLFGLAQAIPAMWRTERAFLVEGAFDLFPLQRHEPTVFATMTAKVTEPVVRLLRRLARQVWLGYDMDARGRKASFEFVRDHGRDFEAHVVAYPKIYCVGSKDLIKDPGDLWEAWGDEKVGDFVHTLVGETL